MPDALIALHYQNDICHKDGRIPFSLKRSTEDADKFFAASRELLADARAKRWLVVHVHIAFAADYANLPRNSRLFLAVEPLLALKRGSWGAAPLAGFEPREDEIALIHTCNSAFGKTGLHALLQGHGVREVQVMGLATQFSVEHTVRDASDLGYGVTVHADCCASADSEAHAASLRTMSMLADVRPSVLDRA